GGRPAAAGRFVGRGWGLNSRVVKWMLARIEGRAEGVETPIGVLPTREALDTEGLDLPEEDLELLLTVDRDVWREEAALVPAHLETFGEHTPKELWDEYRKLVERLG
ncbi:phosphoenolpyruvate carboxykinase domain-containing protein, partial [Streptomyces sp. NPDC059506]|uniref:phosphoenolpyruvate carboxykinase domain-containing protein n=1 Tax=Streptomyces sp. NPDC059506 TaxID=3347751 RepID=UPI0036C207DF